ncbi:MAG: hypothetical protein NC920_00480 [Candidatus Omnitrophica bacterium]|nr:hypothetical protein [Candidatus Omnitrophota bacterium]
MRKRKNKIWLIFLLLNLFASLIALAGPGEIINNLLLAIDDYYAGRIEFPDLRRIWEENLSLLGIEQAKIEYLLAQLERLVVQEKRGVKETQVRMLLEIRKIHPPYPILPGLAENFQNLKTETKDLLVKADFSLAEEVFSELVYLRNNLLLISGGKDSFTLPREILNLATSEEAKIIIEKLQRSKKNSVISTLSESLAFLEENRLKEVFIHLAEKKELIEKFLIYECFSNISQIFLKLGKEEALEIISSLLNPPPEFAEDKQWRDERAGLLANVVEEMEREDLLFTLQVLKGLETEKIARILEHIFFVQRGKLLAHKEMTLEKAGEVINKISLRSLTLLTRDLIEAIKENPPERHSWEEILTYVSEERKEILETFYLIYTQIESLTDATAKNLAEKLENLLEKNVFQDGYSIEDLISDLLLETTVHFEENKEWKRVQEWAKVFNFMQPKTVAEILSSFAYAQERSYDQWGTLSPTTTLSYLLNMNLDKAKEAFLALKDFDYKAKLQSTLVKYLLFPEKYFLKYLTFVPDFSLYQETFLNALNLNNLFIIQTALFFAPKPLDKIISSREDPAIEELISFIQQRDWDKGEKLNIFTQFLRNPQVEKLSALFPFTDAHTLGKVLEIFPDEEAGLLLNSLAEEDISWTAQIVGNMNKEEMLYSLINQSQMVNILNEIEKTNPTHPLLKEGLILSGKVYEPETGKLLSNKRIEIKIKFPLGPGMVSEYSYFTLSDGEGNYKAVIPLWGRFSSPFLLTLSAGNLQASLNISSPQAYQGEKMTLHLGPPPEPNLPQGIKDNSYFFPLFPMPPALPPRGWIL